jgi:RNA polymerase sigma-70 factor (ECF subfamily)
VSDDPYQTMLLVRRLRTGDADAAGMLDRTFREPLLRFCWGYLGTMEEAEDALQEIWYKVLTAENVPDHFKPWIYRIARNHCLNMLRMRARRKDGQALPGASQIAESMTGNLTRLVRDEMEGKLRAVVADLPAAQQEVLRLRYVEGLSRSEIAEVLDLSGALVKSRLFEGIKKLRDSHPDLQGI